jgi:hypothetical protein
MVILVSGRSLIEVLDRLDEVPDDATLHATKPWSSASPTAVSDDDCPPTGFAYLLEVGLAHEVIAVWSRWREGAQPTGLQKCEAVLFYAAQDAYLPRDID